MRGAVTGDVQYVIAQSPHMTTAKMQKAIDRGVKVVGEEFIYRSAAQLHRIDEPTSSAGTVASASAISDALWKEVTVKGVRPLHAMKSGETVQVQVRSSNFNGVDNTNDNHFAMCLQSASSDALHTIKRVFDHYYCTCFSWRNQRNAVLLVIFDKSLCSLETDTHRYRLTVERADI